MTRRTVIVDALRTPIGVKNGALLPLRIDELCATLVRGLLERHPALQGRALDDFVLGCAFPEGVQGMLAARGVALLAGLPVTTPARVVNRFCGSSMDALHSLSQAIDAGDMEFGIAAGMEDMFAVPMGGYNPDFHPGLAASGYYIGMGETAENLAREGNISRGDQEAFSAESHRRALQAREEGHTAREILPVQTATGLLAHDEGPRVPDLARMAALAPAFLADGCVTAATSSPVSKGAAALLVCSAEFAAEHGLPVRAEVVSRAVAGVEPGRMGSGPIPAAAKALARAGMQWKDIDTMELNEAFAAQALFVIREGKWPQEKVNLHGGALALGHPLGASGARILCTLLAVMEHHDTETGLAALCIGGGQGIATIIRRPHHG